MFTRTPAYQATPFLEVEIKWYCALLMIFLTQLDASPHQRSLSLYIYIH